MSELPTSNIEACISRCTCMDDHSEEANKELRALIEYNYRLRIDILELQDTIDGDGFVIDNQRAIIERLGTRVDYLEGRVTHHMDEKDILRSDVGQAQADRDNWKHVVFKTRCCPDFACCEDCNNVYLQVRDGVFI